MHAPLPIKSRIGVYGLAQQQDRWLLIKQPGGIFHNKFDLPGGGVEAGETEEEALRREFLEEVGMAFDTMHFLVNMTSYTPYTEPDGEAFFFRRIGLIYRVEGLRTVQEKRELDSFWLDPRALSRAEVTPFITLLATEDPSHAKR